VKKLLVIFIFIGLSGLIATPTFSQAQDADGDGISDTIDNCPETPNGPDGGTCIFTENLGSLCSIAGANPWECGEGGFCSMEQEDTDKDGLGNACDDCPTTPGRDTDSDGICTNIDNCPEKANGPDAGTCTSGSIEEESTVGKTCTNESECGTDGNCSMDQEDKDKDGEGDVCDPNNINILIVGTGNGAPGSSGGAVTVSLTNWNHKVGGGEVDICDVGDSLTCSASCEITERTSAFTCTAKEQESGCCKVLLIDFEGGSIEEGEGSIFILSYDVSKNASSEECTDLKAELIKISDENSDPLEVTPESGEFCFISTTTSTTSSTTTSTPSIPSINISPNPIWKTHWIPLPCLIMIAGNKTNFVVLKTELLYEPSGAVFSFFPLVVNKLYIWDLVWVMPGWLTGFEDETVSLTVTTDSEVMEDNFKIKLSDL
jgi:hypothetical protein